MPNVEAPRLGMSKRGDELYVEIGNIRREIALPRVLASRTTLGAVIEEGELKVRFGKP